MISSPTFADRNGGLSNWSVWGNCSKECGNGTQTRTRSCTNPTKEGFGADCVGELSQSQICNTHVCPSKFSFMYNNCYGCGNIRFITEEYLICLFIHVRNITDTKTILELEEKKRDDPDFAKSMWMQLGWVYSKTPHYEKTHNLYPVGRLMEKTKIPID